MNQLFLHSFHQKCLTDQSINLVYLVCQVYPAKRHLSEVAVGLLTPWHLSFYLKNSRLQKRIWISIQSLSLTTESTTIFWRRLHREICLHVWTWCPTVRFWDSRIWKNQCMAVLWCLCRHLPRLWSQRKLFSSRNWSTLVTKTEARQSVRSAKRWRTFKQSLVCSCLSRSSSSWKQLKQLQGSNIWTQTSQIYLRLFTLKTKVDLKINLKTKWKCCMLSTWER